MIGPFVTHFLVYVIVGTALSLVWVLLGGGSLEQLGEYARSPSSAVTTSFWPIWIWLGWGAGVAIHLAAVLGIALTPSYWHRRMQRARELRSEGAGAAEAALGSARAPSAGRRAARRRDRVTVMFVDICGSTALNEELGDDAWTDLIRHHRSRVRRCAHPHGGTEVGTQGDGCLLRFADPAAAVRAAVALQRALAAERADAADGVVPRVRAGIHTGDAVHDRGDVLGRTVNVAARVTDVAVADEIVVTEPVADAAADAGLGLAVDDRGLVALKGVARDRHLLVLRWDADA